jgi:hypothetical protein
MTKICIKENNKRIHFPSTMTSQTVEISTKDLELQISKSDVRFILTKNILVNINAAKDKEN